jgi:acetyltransferase-like isoleucine patch superfamily enzyme
VNGPLKFYQRKALIWAAEKLTPPETETDPLRYGCKNRLLRRAGLTLGENVVIMPRFQSIVSMAQYIELADYVAVGSDVKIWSFNTVRIGRFSVIGSGVTLVAGGHDADTLQPTSAPIVIGNGCWIGLGTRILAGVTVGDNALIQPGSLVSRDVPAGAIVEGVPARVVGQREIPEKAFWWGNIGFNTTHFQPVSFA